MTSLVEQRLGLEACWRIAHLDPGDGIGANETFEFRDRRADSTVMQEIDHDTASGGLEDSQCSVDVMGCGPGHVFDGHVDTVLTCEIAQRSKDVDRLVQCAATTGLAEIGDCENMTGPDLAGPAHEGNSRPRIEVGRHPHDFDVMNAPIGNLEAMTDRRGPGDVGYSVLSGQAQPDSGTTVEVDRDIG